MPLGGGTFLVQNKVLPGAYINFISKARALGSLGERGIAALALELNWGPVNEIITIEVAEFQKDILNILGYGYTTDEMKPLREVFKYAKTLKLYRINGEGGKKATATVGSLTIIAKHPGTRGNDIKVTIQTNIDDESKFDVITYVDKSRADTQTVGTISELQPNNFVVFSGTEIEVTAGVNLEGGTNGEVTGDSYSTFLDKIEAEDFNVMGYLGEDDIVKALFTSFAQRLRNDEGIKIVTVLYDYPQADFEGIISVKNNKELVPWVVGASAGAEVNQSLTNRVYNGEYEVSTKYKKSEFEQAIKKGEFAFYQDGDVVRVLTDINTFTSYEPNKNSDFSSNRVIRVLDQIANDTARIFGDYYLGITNNDTTRTLFKNELVNYHEQLQSIQAIEDFVQEDIIVLPGASKKDVIVNEVVKPTDAMEKLYMSVEVQ